MEEEGDDQQLTPFWLDSTTNLRSGERYRRRLSSFFLSSGVLLTILLVTGLLLLVIVIPSTLSLTSQLFRPNIVKRSWDSVNIVLVLFALVFGLLNRRKNEDNAGFDENQKLSSFKSNTSNQNQWYDYSARGYNSFNRSGVGGLRRRTSSSYPDLREVSSPWIAGYDNWRFYDDTQVDNCWVSDSGKFHRRRSWKEFERKGSEIKNIPVDTFEDISTEHSYARPAPSATSSSPQPPPPATPQTVWQREERTYVSYMQPTPESPSPPRPRSPESSPIVKQKPKRKDASVPHKRRRSTNVNNNEEHKASASAITPPPPPPPQHVQHLDKKGSRKDRKSGAANATKDFLNSFYYKKKKKRQRQKSVENLDTLLHQSHTPHPHFQPPQSPRPPPSVLYNLFTSKKQKRKKIISIPPPSPPPVSVQSSSKSKYQTTIETSGQPPLLVKRDSFESAISGGESPLIRILPPPPPPFKMPSWKFVVQGDYARIQSNDSSRCGSPDLDDGGCSPTGSGSSEQPSLIDGGDAAALPLFWPSPDVDAKADSFISKFRAGLKLEKTKFITEKHGLGLSNLGPGSGPAPN